MNLEVWQFWKFHLRHAPGQNDPVSTYRYNCLSVLEKSFLFRYRARERLRDVAKINPSDCMYVNVFESGRDESIRRKHKNTENSTINS